MTERLVGAVTHYFDKVHAAAVELTEGELKVGDTIHVVGHTSDFTQKVESMQVEHEDVESAKPGDDVALGVADRARERDKVYVVTSD